MAWPKGVKRGPRKQRVEILPHDPTATFGPEAYEQIHPIEPPPVAAVEQMDSVVEEGVSAVTLTVRDQILLGLMEPPPHYRKACDYQLGKGPWEIIRCRECGMDTYTRDPLKQDVCEECMWTLMHQLADVEQARVQRNTDRMLNPFKSINPFNELGGSLPSVKRG